MRTIQALSILMLGALPLATSAIEEVEVDTELQLLLDVSGSVDSSEYQLQLDGYANAFASVDLQDAIASGPTGAIAVQLIMWSSSWEQQVMIDWTLIDSSSAANSLSASIATLARPFAGWTAIGSAINYSYPLFDNNGFNGTNTVIDVSGDGTNNQGSSVADASDAALASGVDTINGIVITTSQAVQDQYEQEVVGGQDAFMLVTDNFQTFEEAINEKLIGEITGAPPPTAITVTVSEPSSIVLSLLGVGLVFSRRFRLFQRQEKSHE